MTSAERLSDIDEHRVKRLVRRLDDTHPLSPHQLELIRDRNRLDFSRSYTPQELEAFRSQRSPTPITRPIPDGARDDLEWQLYVFDLVFTDYLRLASPIPPNIPWRITVILRRAKRSDLEAMFLASYFRHFWSPRGSAKDTKLGERALKIGVDIPGIPDSTPLPLPEIEGTEFSSHGLTLTLIGDRDETED